MAKLDDKIANEVAENTESDLSATTATTNAGDSGRQAINWNEVLARFRPRLQELEFEDTDVPSPDDLDAFPGFLARLQVKDPLLASDLSRTVRRFRDMGALPDEAAQNRRERSRALKQAATMRTVEGRLVKDKRKAPLYGLAALLLVLGPLGYMLSRPIQKSPPPTAGNGVETTTADTPKSDETVSSNTTAQPTELVKTVENAGNAAGNLVRSGGEQIANASQQEGGITGAVGESSQNPASGTSSPSAGNSTAPNRENGVSMPTPTPPTVTPPPVAAAPQPSTTTPAPDVYRPVNNAPTDGFGDDVSSSRPVAVTPPARTTSTPSFGDDVSSSRPVAVAPPVITPSTPGRTTSTSFDDGVPKSSTIAASPATTSSSSPSFGDSGRQAVANTPAPANTNTNTRAGSIPAPVVMVPKVATTASTRSASATGTGTNTGNTFGNNVPAPMGLSPVGTVTPEAPVAQRNRATSGLVYERPRPAPVKAAAPADTAPEPETASTTAAPSSLGLFGDTSGANNGASSTAGTAEKPFGSDASVPASRLGAVGPFRNLQQIPVRLVTAIHTLTGNSVPVLVVTADGGSFVGVGTINGQLARVDMTFRRYVAPDGAVSDVDALAYTLEGSNLTQGIPANIVPIAPTLGIDMAQNGAAALQGAVQSALENAGKSASQIAIGDGASISANALPPLWQILMGGVSKTFTMPTNTQSVMRAAKVSTNTPMTLIVGIGNN
ncbi:hypothetical protein [Deinococcus fonticola]|uniref:hypothetical protein n=1 Tax=Deinococcus fonticola TaxID=2528713 RepID=UPI0010754BBF|nr:hypothetical protein [Deinococcus fonticola]